MTGVELGPKGRTRADATTFAVVATVASSGQPHQVVTWVMRDGDTLLLSTVEGRLWHRNLAGNPRVTVLLPNLDDPYSYVEVRGIAALSAEGGRELIDTLSRKYRGHDYPEEPEGTVRLVVRVTPQRVVSRR